MRNRWYEPRTGRFLSEDPIGLAGGLNRYVYAKNDPVNLGDPMGLCPEGTTPVDYFEVVDASGHTWIVEVCQGGAIELDPVFVAGWPFTTDREQGWSNDFGERGYPSEGVGRDNERGHGGRSREGVDKVACASAVAGAALNVAADFSLGFLGRAAVGAYRSSRAFYGAFQVAKGSVDRWGMASVYAIWGGIRGIESRASVGIAGALMVARWEGAIASGLQTGFHIGDFVPFWASGRAIVRAVSACRA